MRQRTTKPTGGGRRRGTAAAEALGDRLRTMFDDVVDEPVPDDFLKLLEQADKNQRGGGDDV